MISKEKIKYFNSLKIKKNRLTEKKIIVEGERLIFEMLKTKIHFDMILISNNNSMSQMNIDIISNANEKNIQIETIDEKIIKKLSSTKNNQSIIGICNFPKYKKINYSNNILALDHISDPGNMGTLLRTAEWFGINNIILSNNCVDLFNAKVIRSGMGAHFYLKSICSLNLPDEIIKLKNKGYSILGADKNGIEISKINSNNKWVLIIGNEANGLSKNIINQLTNIIAIPGTGNIESLNASVAGGILLNNLNEKEKQ